MRVFLAVPIPDTIRGWLAGEVHQVPWADGVRIVDPQRWHLTLAFFGQVDQEPLFGCLEPRLRSRLARAPGFRLRVAGTSIFNRSVGVLTLCGPTPADDSAAAAVARTARRTGARCRVGGGQEHGFRPHITIARQRTGTAELRSGISALATIEGFEWRVDRVELIASHLGAAPYYELLAVIPLAPAAPAPSV